jgi:hypothetical protein
MNRHRSPRPRYGRIALAGTSLLVTVVSVLGGVGALPSAAEDRPPITATLVDAPATPPLTTPSPSTSADPAPPPGSPAELRSAPVDPTALPADSGSGRRVVFSESAQRVWLVGDDEGVRRTYAVSGSLVDNLAPGSYDVFSRSRWAVGIDDSGVMEYFVRFANGQNAAIGFHTIPTRHGVPLQSRADLGTPQSHGCIRQDTADAVALWDFAPIGTPVTVVA